MRIEQALAQIKEESTRISRRTIDSGKIRIVDAGSIELPDTGRFTMGVHAQGQMSRWLCLPQARAAKSLSKRLGPNLYGEVANRLWQHGIGDRSIPLRIRLLQHGGQNVIGFDDPALMTLQSGDVADVLARVSPSDSSNLVVRYFHHTPEGFTLRASTPRISTEVRVGDVVEGGVSISHSNFGATQVRTFLNRLVCRNGMLVPICNGKKALRMRRRSSDDEFNKSLQLDLLGKLVNQSFSDLEAQLSALAELSEHKVNAVEVVRRLSIQHHLSKKVRDALLQALTMTRSCACYETSRPPRYRRRMLRSRERVLRQPFPI